MADVAKMLRTFSIPALLVVAFFGIYLYSQDAKSSGPTSASEQQAVAQAQSEVTATNFGQAAAAMQEFYAQSETYAGAALPPGTDVVLVRADASSYCLQAGGEHEEGPGGQPQTGAC